MFISRLPSRPACSSHAYNIHNAVQGNWPVCIKYPRGYLAADRDEARTKTLNADRIMQVTTNVFFSFYTAEQLRSTIWDPNLEASDYLEKIRMIKLYNFIPEGYQIKYSTPELQAMWIFKTFFSSSIITDDKDKILKKLVYPLIADEENVLSELVHPLIECGIRVGDINVKDKTFVTIGHYAALFDCKNLLLLFLELGGDAYRKEQLGMSPYDLALFTLNREMLLLFLPTEADVDRELSYLNDFFIKRSYKILKDLAFEKNNEPFHAMIDHYQQKLKSFIEMKQKIQE